MMDMYKYMHTHIYAQDRYTIYVDSHVCCANVIQHAMHGCLMICIHTYVHSS